MAKTELLGIGDMRAHFTHLRQDMQTRTGRQMVVAAGGVLKRKAKEIAQANGSRLTGAMIKNIAIKRERGAPPGTEQYHLGVRHGRNLSSKARKNTHLAVSGRGRIVERYADDPYYWKWVELGHQVVPRQPNKGRKKSWKTRRAAATATVPGKPFIGPALEQGRAEAIAAMERRLQQTLAKAGAA